MKQNLKYTIVINSNYNYYYNFCGRRGNTFFEAIHL